ncbi:hypothetical protein CK203_064687 [Vitis vinifera]|uniref:Retrotransposon gag domain-containing protein n=1 Tax=Vitis vinifera TaxID=29760 RepID=A0A438G7S1_VITVI|nr:hypothetical protein CK203_064687 [Vitis vinifera]
MTALLLHDCMSFVHVDRTSIPLPPTLLVSIIPFILVLTIASSACVEVMTTLHGSVPYLRRRAEGCESICSPNLGSVPWVEWERGGIDQFKLEDGYSMPAAQTLHTISHDQVAVIPPIVTPITIIEDSPSHMDRLEQSIRQMRDPDERWYASLESSRRRSWEDLAQEFLRQYSFSGDTSVTHRELECLRQGSDESVSSFISRWKEKAAEMIERPTERDQMSMFLRSLHHRGLWSDITRSPDIEGKGVVGSSRAMEMYALRAFSIDDLVIIPIAFERLRVTSFLVPLAPRPPPEYLTSAFSCSRVLCISPDGRPPY